MATASAFSEPELSVRSESDDVFRVVTHNRPRKGEPNQKRRREESVAVENLNTKTSESDSNNTVYQTPSPGKDTKQTDFKLFITPIDKNKSLKNMSPIKIARAIKDVCVSPVEFIKPVSSGLLVKCKNTKQVRAILQLDNIGNIPVKVTEGARGAKGVIYAIPTEMTEEEILSELRTQQVTAVKRMTKRVKNGEDKDQMETNESKQIPLTSVILTFSTSTLPTSIRMCYQIKLVKLYIPKVVRCFKCQRFGHGAATCRSNMRCVRCGESHKFEECAKKDTPKCVNCGGEHSAAYNGCTQAKKAKQVQHIKITEKITYAQASQIWTNKQNPPQTNIVTQASQMRKEEQENTQIKSRDAIPGSYANAATTQNVPPATTSTPQTQNVLPPRTTSKHLSKIPRKIPQNPSTTSTNSTTITSKKDNEKKENPSVPLNFIATANDDQIIDFICQLILSLTEGKTLKEINNLVLVAAKRSLQQISSANNVDNDT